MKSTSTKGSKKTKKKSVIPGFGLTLGITITMLSLLILIPLASILAYSLNLSFSEFVDLITQKNVMRAFATSIECAFIAALINSVFGLLLAWILVRYKFPGRKLIDGMIELPFALPTAVAGITLAKMYSDQGIAGKFLNMLGIQGSYSRVGLVIALVFIGIPFVVRSVQPVLEKLPRDCEEAADMLGASKYYAFRRVVLPELMPSLLAGFGLAFARGIGEYGSVIYISGNSAKNGTQVVSYVIMQKLNSGSADYDSAAAISLVLLIISFLLLFLINLMQYLYARRGGSSSEYMQSSQVRDDEPESERGAAAIASKRLALEHFTRDVLIVIGVIFFLIMLVYPLISVLYRSLKDGLGVYLDAITAEYTLSALKVTLIATAFALLVNTFFGIIASWLLTKHDFRGKNVLATLIDIPFSISPVIAGLAFIMMFGRKGVLTPFLDWFNGVFGTDIALVFSVPGVVLATIFVTFPFVSRELIPVMNAQGRDEEEAAALLGAKGFTIFRKITLPHIRWALVYGMILCAARAFGEFGAVYAVSKTRGETFTLPLEVDALYMSGTAESITQAFAVSSLLVLMALILLIFKNIAEYRAKKENEA